MVGTTTSTPRSGSTARSRADLCERLGLSVAARPTHQGPNHLPGDNHDHQQAEDAEPYFELPVTVLHHEDKGIPPASFDHASAPSFLSDMRNPRGRPEFQ